ncbi:MAG TPA: HAMP domain-containing sensor histidine kinase, partial [Gemmatimonadaceae bacterium]|nr:HAMP domain-containing sensor histidine kinase [Gemmatimonadaceae bacterium]
IIGVLALLVVAPLVVGARARVHRRLITEVIDPARVVVNNLELAEMTAIIDGVLATHRDTAAARRARIDRLPMTHDLAILTESARILGTDAVERVIDVRRTFGGRSEDSSLSVASTVAAARTTLRTLQALQQWLTERVATERFAARSAERWDIWLPVVLGPLALLAVLTLIRTGQQIVMLADALARDRQALAEVTAAKTTMIRGITHDLKNPLGAVLGYAELLEDGVLGTLPDGQRAVVGSMRRLVSDTVNTIDELLQLARAEAVTLPVIYQSFNLGQLVAHDVEDYQLAARNAQLSLTVISPDHPIEIESDPAHVRQILSNLLTNAIKYTPAGGAITVAVAEDGRRSTATVTVSDTGPGIPVKYRDRVFEEFFRLPQHDRRPEPDAPHGTGVGLAISRHLARLIGGDLRVGDASSGGAAFILSVPMGRPQTGTATPRTTQ